MDEGGRAAQGAVAEAIFFCPLATPPAKSHSNASYSTLHEAGWLFVCSFLGSDHVLELTGITTTEAAG